MQSNDGTPVPVTDNGGTLSVDDGAGSLTVDGTVAVSGTVAVTGPVTDTQLRATALPVSGTVTVTQATAANLNNTAAQGAANTVGNAWPVKNTDGTNTAAVKAASTAAAAADPALAVALSPNSPLPAGTNALGTTLGPTVTKGTQAATGYTVQNLKDAGRTPVTLTVDSVTGITTEALATMTINKGGTVTSATSYAVTAGKTLRVQAMILSVMVPSTVGCASRARLRSAGTVAASSPIFAACATGTGNTAFAGNQSDAPIPDGLEFAAGQQVGISHIESSAIVGSTTTGAGVSICLIGYEY